MQYFNVLVGFAISTCFKCSKSAAEATAATAASPTEKTTRGPNSAFATQRCHSTAQPAATTVISKTGQQTHQTALQAVCNHHELNHQPPTHLAVHNPLHHNQNQLQTTTTVKQTKPPAISIPSAATTSYPAHVPAPQM
jgi:hypothetical protein